MQHCWLELSGCLARRRNNFLATLATNPTWTCIVESFQAGANGVYDQFIGDVNNYTQVH